MAADFSGPIPKENLHCLPQRVFCGESKRQVVLGFSEDHKVVCVELTRETKIREGKSRTPGEARRMAVARLLTKRLFRSGESTRPCAMPVSTQGDETSPRARTCESVPQRKLAIVRHIHPVTPAWCGLTHEVSNASLMSTIAQKVC